MVQVALTASTAGQLLVARKLSGAASEVIWREALLIFVTVIVWGALELLRGWVSKFRNCGVRLAMGAVPVPVKEAVAEPPFVSISTLPLMGPIVVGLNTTLKEQLVPGESTELQLLGVT